MKIGVIGCGKMGTALVSGAVKAGAFAGCDVSGCDLYPAAAESFAEATGGRISKDPAGMIVGVDIVLLCVKPHDARNVLSNVVREDDGSGKEDGGKLLISVVAGVSLAALQAVVPASWRVIRAMPNTPALVGRGATAFCRGENVTQDDAEEAMRLFSSVGLAMEVPERLINAVTGLSGSGPAYGFLCIEAMADGGVAAGLPRDQAIKLAAQTLLGAASMVIETGNHPAVLKDAVASPGGTTIAGIHELELGGLRATMINAVTRAAKRAGELGNA